MRLITVVLVGVLPFVARAAELKTIDGYRDAAAKHNAVLTIPDWEQTPQAVEAIATEAIAKANRALDQIGAQDLSKVTFKSTVVALDDVAWEADIATLYGEKFIEPLRATPVSAFIANGSYVEVQRRTTCAGSKNCCSSTTSSGKLSALIGSRRSASSVRRSVPGARPSPRSILPG